MYEWHYKPENILDNHSDALVIPVNCVGVMGKGLALQFKEKYPEMYKQYVKLCKAGTLTLGMIDADNFLTGNRWDTISNTFVPQEFVMFPTKGHWRENSNYQDIFSGLKQMHDFIKEHRNPKYAIAIPALGCGNGGLEWHKVQYAIVRTFYNSTIHANIFAPFYREKKEELNDVN